MPDNFFFLALSAFALHLALYAPAFLFWLSFFWLVPIFFLALQNRITKPLLFGFFWGVVFYALHLHAITDLFIKQAHGIFRLFFPVILIGYAAIHAGIWFFAAHITGKLLRAKIFSWIFWTTIYLLWVPRGVLWASGQYIGCPFSFPLLSLVQYPLLLRLLPFIGEEALTLCLVCFAMATSLFFVTRKKKFLLFSLFCLIPFLIGFIVPHKTKKLPDFFCKIGHVHIDDPEKYTHPLDAAQELYSRMRVLLKKNPEIKYIFTPELSFRFALNSSPHIIQMWTNNLLHDDVHLFIGAYRQEEGRIFNALYWIQGGETKQVYTKEMLMPFAEYVPPAYKKIPFLCSLFLGDNPEFSTEKNKVKSFRIGNKIVIQPCICAELFFNKQKKSDANLLLATMNDTIFTSSSFNNLLFFWSKYQALKHNKNLLLVGYKNNRLITNSGDQKHLDDSQLKK